MKNILFLIQKEIKLFLKNKFNFIIILSPLSILLIFSYFGNVKGNKFPLAIVQSKQAVHKTIAEEIERYPAFKIIEISDFSKAEQLIMKGQVIAAIDFIKGESGLPALQIIISDNNPIVQELSSALISEAISKDKSKAINIYISNLRSVRIPTRIFLILLQVMLPLLGLNMFVHNIIYEKDKGLLDAINMSGARKIQIIISKLIFYALIILPVISISLSFLQEPFSYKLKALVIFLILSIFYAYLGLEIAMSARTAISVYTYSSIAAIIFITPSVFVDRLELIAKYNYILPSSASQQILLNVSSLSWNIVFFFFFGTIVTAFLFKFILGAFSATSKRIIPKFHRIPTVRLNFKYRNRVLTMVSKNIKELLSFKIILVLVLFFLFITIVLLINMQLPYLERSKVALYSTNDELSNQVLINLTKKTPYSYHQVKSVNEARALIQKKLVLSAILISSRDNSPFIEIIMDDARQPQSFIVANIIRRIILEEAGEKGKYSLIFKKIKGMNLSFFLFTIFIVIQIVVISMGLSSVMAKEKQMETLDALRLTPLSHFDFLTSIMLTAIFASIVVASLMIGISFISGFEISIFLICKLLLICVLLGLSISCLSIIIFPSITSGVSITLAVLELFLILPVAISGAVNIPDTSILFKLNPACIAQRGILAQLIDSTETLVWLKRLVSLDLILAIVAIFVWFVFFKLERGEKVL